ncbi:helix-turn-helix domain-containing protein [Spongisporangium articulatum]|uniref:Helix-turn-helix domain-containing protein n=1 Tax=Spongisporangium articulatum TaxID=3362603 RepID=A0ABW8AK25_9ACTN
MAGKSSNPTVRRLELAARLRELRIQAGRTVDEAAAELMCSPAKISRMETGGRGVQPRDIRDLSRLYNLTEAVQKELQQAAADARKPGWWQDYRSLDEQVRTVVALEDAAAGMFMIETLRFPGLLQTPDITRGLLDRLRPPGEMGPDLIADLVATRKRRRERLIDGAIAAHFVIDEAMFKREIGSPDIMAAQIASLLEDSELPNVTLQVVPFATGVYPATDGSFQILTFDADTPLHDVVYVEGLLGNFIVDTDEHVTHYRTVFEDVVERFALPEEQSKAWLRAARQTWAAAA